MSLIEDRIAINRAANQAWVGFWHSCMRDTGGTSCLPLDEAVVEQALNGHDVAPEIIELEPEIELKPRPELKPKPEIAPELESKPTPELEPLGLHLERTPRWVEPPHRAKSDWAKQLEGDGRTSGITLRDVLIGLDDYFRIFRQMKKVNPHAYAYFSRVGAPLCFETTAIWRRVLENPDAAVVNVQDMPAYFGVFMVRSKETARADVIQDRPGFLDFHLYEKRRKNIAVVSPWKWTTLYDHQEYCLDRNIFTKAERRKFPQVGNWGFHYFIGVRADGRVSALPMQMGRYQTLRNGEQVHHSSFVVPPGLKGLAGDKVTVDQYTTLMFAAVRAFAASALSGVQLSVRKGNEVARFGIPITAVGQFFRDREREGTRRRALLHFVGEYSYQRGDRTITVGEHLRGARRFTWRDHDIILSAPGIHHPAPEALTSELLEDDDILPIPDNTVTLTDTADRMQKIIERSPRVPFRKGEPTVRYRETHL